MRVTGHQCTSFRVCELTASLSLKGDKVIHLKGIEDGRVVFSVVDKGLSLQSSESKCVFKLERDCSIGVASLLKVSPDVVWLSPSELSRGVFHVESNVYWKIF